MVSASGHYFSCGVISGFGVALVLGALYNFLSSRKDDTSDELADDVVELLKILGKPKGNETKRIASAQREAKLKNEQLVRNRQFFGDRGQSKVESSFVVVAGLGGVGSHCAVSLARSGVQRIRLIDFDRVSLSSLNRHACATRQDVGRPKAECLRDHIASIVPYAEVEAYNEMVSSETLDKFIGADEPDFVVDCVDNLSTKADLIVYCKEKSIPIIVASGASAKSDPTKIHIGDLFSANEDQLARATRNRLRSRGVTGNVVACYSTERNERGLLALKDFQREDPSQYVTVDNFRIRVLPVIAPLPATMGQTLAAYVLNYLAGEPLSVHCLKHVDVPVEPTNYKGLFHAVKQFYNRSGLSSTMSAQNLQLSFEDSSSLVINVYEKRSVISQSCGKIPKIQLVPWLFQKSDPSTWMAPSNMICCTQNEASLHLERGGTEELNLSLWGPNVIARVNECIAKAKAFGY